MGSDREVNTENFAEFFYNVVYTSIQLIMNSKLIYLHNAYYMIEMHATIYGFHIIFYQKCQKLNVKIYHTVCFLIILLI